ncbi:MAG: glycosyltransferase [Chitinophagaceae bacterium]
MQKIIIIGSAFPLRGGGITTFNERLAAEFQQLGHEVIIYSFSLQYPSFLFPGKSQYANRPEPKNIKIKSVINSVNPLNWIKVGNQIAQEKPSLVIIRYWLPFMSPALGTIARVIRRKKNTKIVCIADNIIPHEKRTADKILTKYFMLPIDGFITMSNKVTQDLLQFNSNANYKQVVHPLYDNFGKIIDKREARKYLKIEPNIKLVLFFGFIREYKGLDLLLDAMDTDDVKKQSIQLIVAGEFYQNKDVYLDQINQKGISSQVRIIDDFIPDDMVRYYCCAADVIVQPYKKATQSGVTPLAYHFEVPMIVTNVGGLPEMVKDGESGLVCEPNSQSIAEHISEFFNKGVDYFLPGLKAEKEKFSWSSFVSSIMTLNNEIK